MSQYYLAEVTFNPQIICPTGYHLVREVSYPSYIPAGFCELQTPAENPWVYPDIWHETVKHVRVEEVIVQPEQCGALCTLATIATGVIVSMAGIGAMGRGGLAVGGGLVIITFGAPAAVSWAQSKTITPSITESRTTVIEESLGDAYTNMQQACNKGGAYAKTFVESFEKMVQEGDVAQRALYQEKANAWFEWHNSLSTCNYSGKEWSRICEAFCVNAEDTAHCLETMHDCLPLPPDQWAL